jgi:PPOX class probable F420-dependent enzyme
MSFNDEVEQFLAEPNICVLASTGADGAPHAMPMWYLYHGGEILFASGRKSQKVKNIERSGKATVVIDRRETPYYAVMIPGTATIEPALSGDLCLALFSRYLGDEGARRYMVDSMGRDTVSIRVRPDRAVEFQGRAGRDDD